MVLKNHRRILSLIHSNLLSIYNKIKFSQPVGKTAVTANYSTKEFWSEPTLEAPYHTHTHKYWIRQFETTAVHPDSKNAREFRESEHVW